MNFEERLAAIGSHLREELSAEFPMWHIERTDSGRWSATLPGWGSLHADNAAELRERLRRYGGKDAGSDL